jgi:hypothetical protein
MELYYQNWYDKFISELPRTKKLRIISPFVGEQIIRNIQGRFNFNELELITRYNLQDFATGLSSLDALKFSTENGAKIYGINNLHSKIYIFDDRAAIVSSANLSMGGLITNYECGLYTTDSIVISGLHSYFDKLLSMCESPLSLVQCEEWAHRIASIEVPNTPIPTLPDFGATLDNIPKDIRYFVKFLGTSGNRVPLTFTVREELYEGECHYACGFAENKKPRQVNTGDIIFMARQTHSPNNYAIFGKAEAIRFVEGRDRATENEQIRLPWKKKWPNYLRVINPVFIDGEMGNCVLLFDLINALAYQSFPSTQKRYEDGEREINPKRSLNQRPIIPLTQQATEWLVPRFNKCLSRVGKVPDSFITSLPQSEVDPYSL